MRSLLLLLLVTSLFSTEQATTPEKGSVETSQVVAAWAFTQNPGLPNVLILGDSISIGYTLLVRQALHNEANIFHPMKASGLPANCMDSAVGVRNALRWTEGQKWRIIYFNFGLHDLKYLDGNGAYVTPDKGEQVASPEAYAANLAKIVDLLKESGATLIWATTTPVPEGSKGRVANSEIAYNKAALQVMHDKKVAVDDLWSVVAPHSDVLQRHRDPHFTEAGYRALAEAVSSRIRQQLSNAP